jgi:hypothetical protein
MSSIFIKARPHFVYIRFFTGLAAHISIKVKEKRALLNTDVH